MILSFKLLGYCMLFGGLYLFLIDLIWYKAEKFVPTLKNFPQEFLEPRDAGTFISAFIIEFVFFVLMPSIAYGLFYAVIPFSGIRGGISTGLYLILFGMIPLMLLILFRIRIPLVFILYQLLGLMIKVLGVMAITGYLYSL